MKKIALITSFLPFLIFTVYASFQYNGLFLLLLGLLTILLTPFLELVIKRKKKLKKETYDLYISIWNILSFGIFLYIFLFYLLDKNKDILLLLAFIPYLIFNIFYYTQKEREKNGKLSHCAALFLSLLFPFCYLLFHQEISYSFILNAIYSIVALIGIIYSIYKKKELSSIYYAILLLFSVLSFQPTGCVFASCLYYQKLMEE